MRNNASLSDLGLTSLFTLFFYNQIINTIFYKNFFNILLDYLCLLYHNIFSLQNTILINDILRYNILKKGGFI